MILGRHMKGFTDSMKIQLCSSSNAFKGSIVSKISTP